CRSCGHRAARRRRAPDHTSAPARDRGCLSRPGLPAPAQAGRGARRRHGPGAARAGAGRIRAPGTLGGGRPADAAGPLRPCGPRRDRGPAGRLPRAARERRRLPGRATLLCRGPGGGTLRIQRPLAAVQLRRVDRGDGAMSKALVEARDVTLLDLVDRAVDHGVILAGDITISVADIDLIYLGLQVLLASVERVEELRTERERVVAREVHGG